MLRRLPENLHQLQLREIHSAWLFVKELLIAEHYDNNAVAKKLEAAKVRPKGYHRTTLTRLLNDPARYGQPHHIETALKVLGGQLIKEAETWRFVKYKDPHASERHYIYYANRTLPRRGQSYSEAIADDYRKGYGRLTVGYLHLRATAEAQTVSLRMLRTEMKNPTHDSSFKALLQQRTVAEYGGTYREEEDHIYINTHRSDNSRRSFICLNIGREEEVGDRSIGSFAFHGPSCGMCVVERVDHASIKELVKQDPIPPEDIRWLLTDLIASKRLVQERFNLSRYHTMAEEMKNLEGWYDGYYMYMQGHVSAQLHRLSFHIHSGNLIDYYSHDKGGRQAYGYVVNYQNGHLFCRLKRDRLGHFNVHLVLDRVDESDEHGLILRGIHAGLSDLNHPEGGRIMLIKTTASQEKRPSSLINRKYSFKDGAAILSIFRQYPYLEPFLAGTNNHYLDTVVINGYRGLHIRRLQLLASYSNIKPYVGFYLSFRPSTSNEKLVYQRLIQIKELGYARRYVQPDLVLEGLATKTEEQPLSLQFDRIVGKETVSIRHSLIHSAERWGAGQQRKALTVRTDGEGAPIAFTEIFLRLPAFDPENKPSNNLDQYTADWSLDNFPGDARTAEIVNRLFNRTLRIEKSKP